MLARTVVARRVATAALAACGLSAALSACGETCLVDDDDTWVDVSGSISIPESQLDTVFPISFGCEIVDEGQVLVAVISRDHCEVPSGGACSAKTAGLATQVDARLWLDSAEAQDFADTVSMVVEATGADGSLLHQSEHVVSLEGEPGSSSCPRSRTGSFAF